MNLSSVVVRFVYLCDGLLETEAIDKNRFAVDFLPTLLQLGSDSVPNIRIAVARTLRNHVTSSGEVMGILRGFVDSNPQNDFVPDIKAY